MKAGLVVPKPSLEIYFLEGVLALKMGRVKEVTCNSSKCFLYHLASFFGLPVLSGLSSAGKGEEMVLPWCTVAGLRKS